MDVDELRIPSKLGKSDRKTRSDMEVDKLSVLGERGKEAKIRGLNIDTRS